MGGYPRNLVHGVKEDHLQIRKTMEKTKVRKASKTK